MSEKQFPFNYFSAGKWFSEDWTFLAWGLSSSHVTHDAFQFVQLLLSKWYENEMLAEKRWKTVEGFELEVIPKQLKAQFLITMQFNIV